jgi:hypothetical protein
MRTQTTRTIAGRVNADGSLATGSEVASIRNSTGNYTLRFAPSFRLQQINVLTFNSGNTIWYVAAGQTDRSVTLIVIAASTGAALDAGFVFTAVGAGA